MAWSILHFQRLKWFVSWLYRTLRLGEKSRFDHFSRVSGKKNLFLLVNFVIQGPTKKEDCFHISTNFSTIYPRKNKQLFLNDTYENWVHILREGEEI